MLLGWVSLLARPDRLGCPIGFDFLEGEFLDKFLLRLESERLPPELLAIWNSKGKQDSSPWRCCFLANREFEA